MDKQKFGQFIKNARIKKNLTQAELADRLYIHVTAVSKWERGVSLPDISMITDICKCLDITEHELIESSQDTEYRKIKHNSDQYIKNRKVAFWSITGSFLLAIFICFIVNLSVGHTLSWFWIVFTSCICGYWMLMYPILFKKCKMLLSEEMGTILKRFSHFIYYFGLLMFTITILLTSNAYHTFDISMALKITLYSSIIFLIYGIIYVFRFNLYFRLGIDTLLTGIYCVSLSYVLPHLMQVEQENYFDIDFTDWTLHSNGNVSFIILVTLFIIGCILLSFGIKKKVIEKNEKTI